MPQILTKWPKLGLLSLVSMVTRAPIIKISMFITTTRYDLATKKDFTKKCQKLAEVFSENLENHGFLVYHASNNGHVKAWRADKVSIVVFKVVQEDFRNTIKNYIDCIFCLFFFTNFFTIRGVGTTTPGAINC